MTYQMALQPISRLAIHARAQQLESRCKMCIKIRFREAVTRFIIVHMSGFDEAVRLFIIYGRFRME
jgi:hypothetical protein